MDTGLPTTNQPTDPPATTTPTHIRIWEKRSITMWNMSTNATLTSKPYTLWCGGNVPIPFKQRWRQWQGLTFSWLQMTVLSSWKPSNRSYSPSKVRCTYHMQYMKQYYDDPDKFPHRIYVEIFSDTGTEEWYQLSGTQDTYNNRTSTCILCRGLLIRPNKKTRAQKFQ
jgi:hypothetical protein